MSFGIWRSVGAAFINCHVIYYDSMLDKGRVAAYIYICMCRWMPHTQTHIHVHRHNHTFYLN